MQFQRHEPLNASNRIALLLLSLLLLAGCSASSDYSGVDTHTLGEIQSAIDESFEQTNGLDEEPVTQPPEDVLQALVPGLRLDDGDLDAVEERFDFAVQQPMDAREFFALLTAGTDYSVAVHPGVTGSISALDLKNVTLEEALDQVSDLYGFVVNKVGNIYQIMPGGLQTKIFYIDYLNVKREGNSNMQIVATGITQGQSALNTPGFNNALGIANSANRGTLGGVSGLGGTNTGAGGSGSIGSSNSGGASINTSTEADYWDGLESIILQIINSGQVRQTQESSVGGLLSSSANNQRSVIVSPQTGMIVVRAFPEELQQVEEFLSASQEALQRQVILEAKILEVELTENFQAGIDLSALGTLNGNGISGEFRFLGDQFDAIGSPMAMTYNSSDFNTVIKLLESQGNVQVISSPRISTLNNQKAVFKVGDEQFFLTSANTTSFGSGDLATTNQNTNLQPFFSGIALDVTPQISAAGDITLHIHPILSQVKEDLKVIGGEEFPLANSTTRESDSIARARNGEVIVISGLMQTRARGQEAGVPGAREVPFVGNAFEQKQRETVKTELVILLRALVDPEKMMQEMLDEHRKGFDEISKQLNPY